MGANVSAASSKKRRNQDVEPEINVTPLVDVVLVLLIIFMVVAPAINEGENIELPAIFNVDKAKDVEPLDVTMAPDGTVIVGSERIAESSLREKLAASFFEAPDRKVMLKADFNTPYARVRKTFALAQDVGFKGISLKVAQRKPDGAS